MVSILSKNMKRQVRHIDTVTVKGSNIPVEFYTFDCDLNHLALHNGHGDINQLYNYNLDENELKIENSNLR
jgi:hypothetical protein